MLSPSGRPPAPLTVRVRPGPPLAAVLATPELRAAAARLGEHIIRRWPRPGGCTVVVVHNRSTIFSLREREGALQFHVHWAALPHEHDLLASLLHQDKEAWRRVQSAFGVWRAAEEQRGALRPARQAPLAAEGEVHDLRRLFQEENQAHFEGRLDAPIGWGRWPAEGARARIRLGSCGGKPPRIRLHPVLDHEEVPEAFVRFIVFHEMLHLAMPPRPGSGSRRLIHPASFRAAERAHPDYPFATAWEQANVERLMRRARHRARQEASQRASPRQPAG